MLTLINKFIAENQVVEFIEQDKDSPDIYILMRKISVLREDGWYIRKEVDARTYIETREDLMNHIMIAMDDDTSIYIIPAKDVVWSPKDKWYFIY